MIIHVKDKNFKPYLSAEEITTQIMFSDLLKCFHILQMPPRMEGRPDQEGKNHLPTGFGVPRYDPSFVFTVK